MKHTFTCLLLLLPFTLLAQLKTIAEGPTFREPEDGYARIIALKDGGTAFLHITEKDGIDIRIYDPAHKEIAAKTIEPEYGRLRVVEIEGIYEIDKSIVAFISEWEEKIPTLYRLTLDERTGDIKELKTIATLNKGSMAQGYATVFGGVPMPGFLVRKDPYSDAYGVIRYNTFESDRAQRVELIQYDQSGTETARNYLSSPDTKYKYTQILDFVIRGTNAYALLYSYNTANSGGAANELLLASISDNKVSYQNLGKSITRKINDGILRYNPISKNLIFITAELIRSEKDEDRYATQFTIIDPQSATMKQPIEYSRGTITAKHRKIFKDEEPFAPLPQNLYINDDGTFTVLLEEVTQLTRTNYRNGVPLSTSNSGIELGSAVVVTFSEDGKEKSAILIPKLQTLYPRMLRQAYRNVTNFYISQRDNTTATLSQGNQYKSLVYLNGKKKNYILLNDIEDNAESINKGKLTNIKGVGDCDAWCYDLSDVTSLYPPRTMIFKNERKRDHNLAIFNISDYDRERDVYATLKLEKGDVKLVWLSGE